MLPSPSAFFVADILGRLPLERDSVGCFSWCMVHPEQRSAVQEMQEAKGLGSPLSSVVLRMAPGQARPLPWQGQEEATGTSVWTQPGGVLQRRESVLGPSPVSSGEKQGGGGGNVVSAEEEVEPSQVTVLIVDDDPVARRLTRSFLKRAGCHVLQGAFLLLFLSACTRVPLFIPFLFSLCVPTVSSSWEFSSPISTLYAASGVWAAVKWLQSVHVDLALLDVLMPEVDGIQLLRLIRQAGDTDMAIISGLLSIDLSSLCSVPHLTHLKLFCCWIHECSGDHQRGPCNPEPVHGGWCQ